MTLFGLFLLVCSLLMFPGSASAKSSIGRDGVGMTASANLQHSPIGGTILIYNASNKTLTVKTMLVGLAPNSTHPSHIHMGPCSNLAAPIKYSLNNVVANADGQAISTTVLTNIMTPIPANGWSLLVHNGPTMQPADQYAPIGCADLVNPKNLPMLAFPLRPTAAANENASGTVRLSLVKGTLTVTLSVRGLAPNTMHAAHIHAGNCLDSKQVLYDMSPLRANAYGVATKTVSFSNVAAIPASGWAINIHYFNDISTQTGYNPILCGNVVKG